MKTCNACHQEKPLTEFYSKTAQCIPCKKAKDTGRRRYREDRKDDEALILQLVDALCECAEDSQEQLDRMEAARLRDYKPNAIAWQEDTIAKAKAAITAGRVRLESKL